MRIAPLGVLLLTLGCYPATQSPYAGQQNRDLKALGADEVKALLDGEGMGYAKVAELNGYPGPRHVLELAGELELSRQQQAAVEDSWNRMHAAAVRLGEQIVGAERELDRLFADRAPAPEAVAVRLEEIGKLSGRLRNAHVAAHLEVKALLNDAQVARYVELRGYHSHH